MTYDTTLINEVIKELDNSINNGNTMKEIADSAGVCQQTVSRLFYRETTYPRLKTVVNIGLALGMTMHWNKPNITQLRRIA